MLFDRTTFTLTLDLKDCTPCFGKGLVATRIDCPTCKGTGNGARGGARGCRMCCGSGNWYDHDNLSTCPTCKGSPHRAQPETWGDGAPAEAVAALQLRVARQDREASWNESFLGLNSLWSSTDYGKAWERTDIDVLTDVREHLLKGRTHAILLLAGPHDRKVTTAPIVRGLVVVVSRGGYSVRPDTSTAENSAEREPGYALAHRIAAAVCDAGGNGAMAATMPLPDTNGRN
jgi:hypothetical protein